MVIINSLDIEFIKIAKKLDISMTRSTPKIIEINELDKEKINEFRYEIRKVSPSTLIRDLISNGEHIDTNGYNITGDKAKYLTDNDYYNELIGLGKIEQISMF